jgi:acyl CoA:acetate/3-ketoacid CoA transferase beta subunit
MSDVTRAEVCVVACADAWRGDGAVLASAFGMAPTLGARLAKATFEPDLLVSDGEAMLIAGPLPYGSKDAVVEGWIPFRSVFDTVWSGRRHVMMGATQIDRHGNQNISVIGDHAKPAKQLIGVRGAPGNTVSHATSYWIPRHVARTFVERVDMICGVGTDRGAADLRRVVTNLCVCDFEGPDRTMRIRSLHPGVTVDEVVQNTGFELAIPEDLGETRFPTREELALIRDVLDARSIRDSEVRA